MKITHLSTVSALALMLAIGAPATAQTVTQQPADEPTVGQTQPGDQPTVGQTQPGDQATVGGTTPQYGVHERMSVADLEEVLGEIGIEDRELFAGQIVVARTDDGNPVFMLIGPEDFERGELAEFDVEAFGDLRERLSDAGFEDVRDDRTWQVFQGTLNGHFVFAASGDPDWGVDVAERTTRPRTGDAMPGTDIDQQRTDAMTDTTQPQTGDAMTGTGIDQQRTDTMTGVDTTQPRDDTAERGIGEPGIDTTQPGVTEPGVTEPGVDLAQPDVDETPRALARDFDRDKFEEKLGEVGFEDRTEFQGKLVYARTEDGQSIRLLIGPEGFAGDEEIELSEDELREKLEDAGLTNVRVIDENISMVRGTYNDHSVLILGGGITEDQMRMGALEQQMPETDRTELEEEAE